MLVNRKFNKLSDALTYSNQNKLKTLAINIKYNNKEANKTNYIYNFLCITTNDYYKFIKKELDYIEVINCNETIEKIYNNFNFEILTNNKRKLHFDLDHIRSDINKTIETFKAILKKYVNITDEPIIFKRPNNNSIHIIYHNYSIDYLQNSELSKFINLEIDEIDISIYTRNRFFNLPYNTKKKYGNTNYFEPYNDFSKDKYINDINDILINNINNTNFIEFKRILKLETNKANKIIASDNIKLINDLITNLPQNFYDNYNYWKLLIHFLYTNGYDYITFLKHSAGVKNLIYDDIDKAIYEYINKNIKNKNMNSKSIFNLIAKKYDCYYEFNINYTHDYIKWICSITEINENILIKKLDYDNGKEKTNIKLNDFILLKSQILLSNDKFYYYPLSKIDIINDYKKTSEIIDIIDLQKHISLLDINNLYRLCGINAKYGSGKSFYIVMELLKKQNAKILIITENNALNQENLTKYNDFQIVNHLQLQNKSITGDKFRTSKICICSIESIEKCPNDYDIIILDEYETLINHFSSETLNTNLLNDYNIFKNFKNKLINSKSVFCLDADLSLERINIIENIIKSKAKLFYCENNKFVDTIHNIYYKKNEFIDNIYNDLRDNKKICICSNTLNELKIYKTLINKKFSNKKIMFICSNNDVELINTETNLIDKKMILENLEENIIKYKIDIFFYSPSIMTGISINKPIFNKLYAIAYNKFVCNSRQFIQMLYRNRNLINNTINILFKCYYNKYTYTNNKSVIEFNLKMLLKEKYKEINETLLDNDYYNLRLSNEIENKYSDRYFTQDTLTRLTQHNFKINLIYNNKNNDEINNLYNETKDLLTTEKLNKITEIPLINENQLNEIIKKDKKTAEECLLIDKFFIFKNSGIYQYNNLFFNPNTDTINNDYYYNKQYIKDLITNKNIIDFFKYKQHFNNTDKEKQYIDNDDKKNIKNIKLYELLNFFNCINFYNEISNEDLSKLIINNKKWIKNNFNSIQSVLLETNYINYEIETKDDILIKNVISLLKHLKDYGLYCGFFNSGNMFYNSKTLFFPVYNYSYNHKENARLKNNKSIFYIVNSIKFLFNFNNYYFNYINNNIKKIFLDDKIIIENGQKKDINKKNIKTLNSSVIEDNKRVRQKMLIETNEILHYNKINIYDNNNKCGIIKTNLVRQTTYKNVNDLNIKLNYITASSYTIKIDIIIPRQYTQNTQDTSIYNGIPKIKETKIFYTNKKLPNLICKEDFDKDDFYEKLKYSIHIKPFIKHKKIFRPFYKDYFILYDNDYIDYMDTTKYINKEDILNEADDIIKNYQPNNLLVSNFIPIKIYRYGINSLILYKNVITNEKIPNYNELNELKKNKCNIDYDYDYDNMDIDYVYDYDNMDIVDDDIIYNEIPTF